MNKRDYRCNPFFFKEFMMTTTYVYAKDQVMFVNYEGNPIRFINDPCGNLAVCLNDLCHAVDNPLNHYYTTIYSTNPACLTRTRVPNATGWYHLRIFAPVSRVLPLMQTYRERDLKQFILDQEFHLDSAPKFVKSDEEVVYVDSTEPKKEPIPNRLPELDEVPQVKKVEVPEKTLEVKLKDAVIKIIVCYKDLKELD